MQHDSKLLISNLKCERTDQLIAACNISGTWTSSQVGWNVDETLQCPGQLQSVRRPGDVIYFLKGLSKTFSHDQKILTYQPTYLPTYPPPNLKEHP